MQVGVSCTVFSCLGFHGNHLFSCRGHNFYSRNLVSLITAHLFLVVLDLQFEDSRDAEDAIRGRDGYNFDGNRLRVSKSRSCVRWKWTSKPCQLSFKPH